MSAIHLQPTTSLAERVLLPGDPGRALLLAQTLLAEPKMFNHNRGLWGYTGTAADAELLTIQSTGMGGPSVAIVASELVELGARRLVRVGTCGALDDVLALGELLIVTEALALDGTSRALGAGERVPANPELLAALRAAAGDSVRSGPVGCTDLYYDGDDSRQREIAQIGALAVEMESAALLTLASTREGVQAAAALIVTELPAPRPERIDPHTLRDAEQRLGELAYDALSATAAA